MIDVGTIYALELVQNIEDPRSKHCLFGLMNVTQSPMAARQLRANILQPSTDQAKIEARLSAVEELMSCEESFYTVRHGPNLAEN
jgi:DNA mismatch repair protein MSH4